MSQEKIYKFSGDSSGLEASMSKIRSAASNTFSSLTSESDKYNNSLKTQSLTLSRIVDEAHKYSSSSKEQIRYISDVSKAIETKNKNEYLETVQVSKQVRDTELSGLSAEVKSKGLRGNKAEEYKNSRIADIDSEYKNSIKNAKEEYNEQKTQTSYLKQLPDAIKNSAKDQIVENRKSGDDLQNVIEKLEASKDPKDKITANILKEQLNSEGKSNTRGKKGASGGDSDMLGSLISFSYIDNIFSALKTAGQSQTAYDLVKPAINIAGALTGNLVQTAAEAAADFFLDGDKAKAVGRKVGQLGGKITEGFFGLSAEVIQRNFDAQQGVFKAYNKSRSVTGKEFNINDLGRIGYDFETVAGSAGDIAKQYGSTRNLSRNITASYSLDRGYGLSQQQISPIIEIQRNTNKDLVSTISGILGAGQNSYFKGGDRTFLSEFTQKFTQLQKELLKGSTSVSDVKTYDILSAFNGVGGQFKTSDFRAMGNIGSIQNSLSNPGSEAFRAMAFSALRKNSPNASLFDIQSEMEKGLGSENYLQTVLSMVDGLGGSDDYKKFTLQGIFGLSAAATNDLFKNKNKLKTSKFGNGEFQYSDGSQIINEAMKNTSQLDINAAEIKNQFVLGATEGVIEIGERFLDVITEAFQGSRIELQNGALIIGKQTQNSVNILKKQAK